MAALWSCWPAAAQPGAGVKDLAQGRFLVASRELMDPNFGQTVVLLIRYGEEGAAGLVVNRRTKIPLSRVFEDLKGGKRPSDPAYLGGPVGITGVLGLLRSPDKPKEADLVVGDVSVTSSKALLEKKVSAGEPSSAFRVYLGYAGWGKGQLEREVRIGAWHIFRGGAELVFDDNPGSLWQRMIQRAETRIARVERRRRSKGRFGPGISGAAGAAMERGASGVGE